MRAEITISMDSSAFELPATELGRILRNLAERIEEYGEGIDPYEIFDANGNSVGWFKIKE